MEKQGEFQQAAGLAATRLKRSKPRMTRMAADKHSGGQSYLSARIRVICGSSVNSARHRLLMDEPRQPAIRIPHPGWWLLWAAVLCCAVFAVRFGVPYWRNDLFLSEMLRRVVDTLPEKARMVVILRYQEDLDPSEIARVLEMPLNTVKSHLRRSLSVLRDKLSRTLGEVML